MWDVTDKDIDKLSMECMRIFFEPESSNSSSGSSSGSENSHPVQNDRVSVPANMHGSNLNGFATLAQALATSRNICKLKNAVGSAPVMYGIPDIYVTFRTL